MGRSLYGLKKKKNPKSDSMTAGFASTIFSDDFPFPSLLVQNYYEGPGWGDRYLNCIETVEMCARLR